MVLAVGKWALSRQMRKLSAVFGSGCDYLLHWSPCLLFVYMCICACQRENYRETDADA